MTQHLRWFVVIVMLTAFCVWLSLPSTNGFSVDFDNNGQADLTINQPLGLDLIGGLRVLLQAEAPAGTFSIENLQETANSVGRRVNALGLSEATVQIQGADRVLVELPGVVDVQQAINTIQQTALLEFVDFGGLNEPQVLSLEGLQIATTPPVENPCVAGASSIPIERPGAQVNPNTGMPFQTIMTGACLEGAQASFGPVQQGGQSIWFIEFQVKPEAVSLFGSFTAARVGQSMAIVLDGIVLSAPTINSALDTGGIITGSFTRDSSTQLALQLQSGSLPIPLRVESATKVGATLGQESVALSIRAGSIGIIVVLVFMIVYYRLPGMAAAGALLVFVVLNLAVFKLIPVTLTLPAITGFLISVGTAVDGNILIFERMKEELRSGRTVLEAQDAGFDRAWTSIRDSNLSTIIICVVLFLFGQTPGASIVSGFAITLILGLTINLFTAVIVTRTFLGMILIPTHGALAQRRWLLGA